MANQDKKTIFPLALPEGFDLNPDVETPDGSVMGAAMRMENPVVSAFGSFDYDPNAPVDPSYRPFDEIQGTEFEPYAERFVGAMNAEQGAMMRAQIKSEIEDRKVLDAAGGWGFMASMAAAILSPTSLLPGGAVVKGITGGVKIGKSAMSVAGANAFAAGIDEIALHGSQQTRTGLESGFAIGGSVILGGLLGAGAGALSRKAHIRTSTAIEGLPEAINEFDGELRNLSSPVSHTPRPLSSSGKPLFGEIGDVELSEFQGQVNQSLSDAQENFDKAVELEREVLGEGTHNGQPITNEQKAGMTASIAKARSILANAKRNVEQIADEFTWRSQDEEAGGSLSAAAVGQADFTVRGRAIETLNKIPGIRGLVRSDPLLRGMLSTLNEARRATSELFETALQYKTNVDGKVVGEHSVETVIKARRNTELSGAFASISRAYADYANDGPAGKLATITAPIKTRIGNLTAAERKYTATEFNKELGVAMFLKDQHHIPQIANEAKKLRRTIMDVAKQDAIDVGIFDEALQLKHGESYMSRLYNAEKIRRHHGDGSENDIAVILRKSFMEKRDASQIRLDADDTVERATREKMQLEEQRRGAQRGLKKTTQKANDKADRARAAAKREGAVGRVAGGLRKAFKARSESLSKGIMSGEELDAFKEMVGEARAIKRLEPPDILYHIRDLGGIKDDGTGELQAALDTKLSTIKRSDGMHPDDMRSSLEGLGYLPEDSTMNDMYALMNESASGQKVYSLQHASEVARYDAALEFEAAMSDLGIDVTAPLADILKQFPGQSRSPKTTKAKAGEAGRSSKKAGTQETKAEARAIKAAERLEDALERSRIIEEEVTPKVKAEMAELETRIGAATKSLDEAKAARSSDDYYASADDLEIDDAVEGAINSILGLKPGEHSYHASLGSPTKARTLDVTDELLMPWLETDITLLMGQYHHAMIPDIEITRRIGTIRFKDSELYLKMVDEKDRRVRAAKSPKERDALVAELENRTREFQAMIDRMRGIYGVPDNPKDIIVRAGRGMRVASYTGYLGQMTLSALPDVANVVGRNGIEAAFGATTLLTDPKRLGLASKDAADLGAAAEWWLNSRAMSLMEITDQYGANTPFERGLAAVGQGFGKATGMIQWNAGWKSVGGAMISSKMSKAVKAVVDGTATRKQITSLAESRIDGHMAARIADQLDKFGDMDGQLWLPQAGKWEDVEAFEVFRNAFNREVDIMIVTPGQDKPLWFSKEHGKFFSQFKSFSVSAHHRILLSGLQRMDADVLAQFTTAVILGGLVSNLKASLGGYEQKEGAAYWEDAIDRSGLSGWLFEAHGLANGLSGGKLSLSGEELSRFQSRSAINGVLGPSVDMGIGFYEGIAAMSRGEATSRDARKVLRPFPGNNLPYVMGRTRAVADALADMF